MCSPRSSLVSPTSTPAWAASAVGHMHRELRGTSRPRRSFTWSRTWASRPGSSSMPWWTSRQRQSASSAGNFPRKSCAPDRVRGPFGPSLPPEVAAMRTDQWLLFGHLVGVLILFGAIVLENLTLIFMLRARSVDELRAATVFAPLLHVLFPVGAVLILGFGVGLVAHSDEFKFGDAFVDLGLALLIVLAVAGPTIQGRRTDRVADMARSAPAGPIPAEVASLVRDPVLRTAVFVSSWIALGIVFLM